MKRKNLHSDNTNRQLQSDLQRRSDPNSLQNRSDDDNTRDFEKDMVESETLEVSQSPTAPADTMSAIPINTAESATPIASSESTVEGLLSSSIGTKKIKIVENSNANIHQIPLETSREKESIDTTQSNTDRVGVTDNVGSTNDVSDLQSINSVHTSNVQSFLSGKPAVPIFLEAGNMKRMLNMCKFKVEGRPCTVQYQQGVFSCTLWMHPRLDQVERCLTHAMSHPDLYVALQAHHLDTDMSWCNFNLDCRHYPLSLAVQDLSERSNYYAPLCECVDPKPPLPPPLLSSQEGEVPNIFENGETNHSFLKTFKLVCGLCRLWKQLSDRGYPIELFGDKKQSIQDIAKIVIDNLWVKDGNLCCGQQNDSLFCPTVLLLSPFFVNPTTTTDNNKAHEASSVDFNKDKYNDTVPERTRKAYAVRVFKCIGRWILGIAGNPHTGRHSRYRGIDVRETISRENGTFFDRLSQSSTLSGTSIPTSQKTTSDPRVTNPENQHHIPEPGSEESNDWSTSLSVKMFESVGKLVGFFSAWPTSESNVASNSGLFVNSNSTQDCDFAQLVTWCDTILIWFRCKGIRWPQMLWQDEWAEYTINKSRWVHFPCDSIAAIIDLEKKLEITGAARWRPQSRSSNSGKMGIDSCTTDKRDGEETKDEGEDDEDNKENLFFRRPLLILLDASKGKLYCRIVFDSILHISLRNVSALASWLRDPLDILVHKKLDFVRDFPEAFRHYCLKLAKLQKRLSVESILFLNQHLLQSTVFHYYQECRGTSTLNSNSTVVLKLCLYGSMTQNSLRKQQMEKSSVVNVSSSSIHVLPLMPTVGTASEPTDTREDSLDRAGGGSTRVDSKEPISDASRSSEKTNEGQQQQHRLALLDLEEMNLAQKFVSEHFGELLTSKDSEAYLSKTLSWQLGIILLATYKIILMSDIHSTSTARLTKGVWTLSKFVHRFETSIDPHERLWVFPYRGASYHFSLLIAYIFTRDLLQIPTLSELSESPWMIRWIQSQDFANAYILMEDERVFTLCSTEEHRDAATFFYSTLRPNLIEEPIMLHSRSRLFELADNKKLAYSTIQSFTRALMSASCLPCRIARNRLPLSLNFYRSLRDVETSSTQSESRQTPITSALPIVVRSAQATDIDIRETNDNCDTADQNNESQESITESVGFDPKLPQQLIEQGEGIGVLQEGLSSYWRSIQALGWFEPELENPQDDKNPTVSKGLDRLPRAEHWYVLGFLIGHCMLNKFLFFVNQPFVFWKLISQGGLAKATVEPEDLCDCQMSKVRHLLKLFFASDEELDNLELYLEDVDMSNNLHGKVNHGNLSLYVSAACKKTVSDMYARACSSYETSKGGYHPSCESQRQVYQRVCSAFDNLTRGYQTTIPEFRPSARQLWKIFSQSGQISADHIISMLYYDAGESKSSKLRNHDKCCFHVPHILSNGKYCPLTCLALCLKKMSSTQLSKFLQFVTASPMLTVPGFQPRNRDRITIVIQRYSKRTLPTNRSRSSNLQDRSRLSMRLPTVSTCAKTLTLPVDKEDDPDDENQSDDEEDRYSDDEEALEEDMSDDYSSSSEEESLLEPDTGEIQSSKLLPDPTTLEEEASIDTAKEHVQNHESETQASPTSDNQTWTDRQETNSTDNNKCAQTHFDQQISQRERCLEDFRQRLEYAMEFGWDFGNV